MSIKRTYWTKQEIDILCAMYSNTKAAYIQDILTRHSLNSIYKKARELMLDAYSFHLEEIHYIRSMAQDMTVKQLSQKMGYSERTIYRRLKAMRTNS